MIYAHIDDARNYYGLGEAFAAAFKDLAGGKLAGLSVGKHAVIPGKVWYSIDEPATQALEDRPFEAHGQFIDIQMTLSGEELIGYAPRGSLTPASEYDAARDIQYFKGRGLMLDCTKGMFALFFPEDAHQPCVAPRQPSKVRKVVVKIHTSLLKGGIAE